MAATRLTLILVIVLCAPLLAFQRSPAITATEIRALTREAQSAAKGDKNELVLELDERVRARWGDFESFPISLVKRDDLRITLASPYMAYRRTLSEYLRINRPVTEVPWVDAMTVAVEPLRIGAPDITRIGVERAGRDVPASEDRLRAMTFADGSGRESMIHSGEIRFPASAFAPGAPVVVTAVPQSGTPFVTPLDDAVLRTLR